MRKKLVKKRTLSEVKTNQEWKLNEHASRTFLNCEEMCNIWFSFSFHYYTCWHCNKTLFLSWVAKLKRLNRTYSDLLRHIFPYRLPPAVRQAANVWSLTSSSSPAFTLVTYPSEETAAEPSRVTEEDLKRTNGGKTCLSSRDPPSESHFQSISQQTSDHGALAHKSIND